MTALLVEGSVDSVLLRPRSNSALGFRFGLIPRPAGQWPSVTGAVITSLTMAASDGRLISVPAGPLRSRGEAGRSVTAQRDSRESNAVSLASLCSGTAGTCTGKSQVTTETPSLTSVPFCGHRDARNGAPARPVNLAGGGSSVRLCPKAGKPAGLRQKTPGICVINALHCRQYP
jgi:hypothetical protein